MCGATHVPFYRSSARCQHAAPSRKQALSCYSGGCADMPLFSLAALQHAAVLPVSRELELSLHMHSVGSWLVSMVLLLVSMMASCSAVSSVCVAGHVRICTQCCACQCWHHSSINEGYYKLLGLLCALMHGQHSTVCVLHGMYAFCPCLGCVLPKRHALLGSCLAGCGLHTDMHEWAERCLVVSMPDHWRLLQCHVLVHAMLNTYLRFHWSFGWHGFVLAVVFAVGM
ncbi:hypothetical protein COO60DRAFT_708819 [Scenedesmus sp. NREL 46B-D3]|nr:hypothetical protein COO60DRAFT_708819 [Scenedesmus sp. NREL 46B-D3]